MLKSRLTSYEPVPLFSLVDRSGQAFDMADTRRRGNLLLFFLTQPDKAFLSGLDEVCGRLRQKNAIVVVVVACPIRAIADVCQEHRLLFVLLADEDRRITSRYLEVAPHEEAAALFMADRAGTLFFQCVAASAAELPPWDDVSASLDFIESQQLS